MPEQPDSAQPLDARLQALHRSGLLDAPPDEALDRLTRLATRLLGAPVALVSLVDADRQFFASATGLEEPWASARETPLEMSVCKYAVAAGDQPLIIDDTRHHALPVDTPALRDFGVRAYLGVPLGTHDGHSLGTLCVVDHQPRRWSDEDVAVVRDLAASATLVYQLRRWAGRAQGAGVGPGAAGHGLLEATEALWHAGDNMLARVASYDRLVSDAPNDAANHTLLLDQLEIDARRLEDAAALDDAVLAPDAPPGLPHELLVAARTLRAASRRYVERLRAGEQVVIRSEQGAASDADVDQAAALMRTAEDELRDAVHGYQSARRRARLPGTAA